MPDYSKFDAAIEAARGASNRTAFYNASMQARRANTTNQYVSRNAAALAARKSSKSTASHAGGWKGALGAVMESPVGAALKTLDVPRSYVASHISDFAQEVEQGDVGGAIGALGRGVGLGVVGEIADAAQGKGFDVAGILNSYQNERNRKDFWAHTGVGTYLQRGINKHHLQGTWVDNRALKIGVGLAGDIGLDPITWATGGIKGGIQAAGREILEKSGTLAVEAGEKAAQEAAAKGASLAEQEAARIAAHEAEIQAGHEAVATLGKRGTSGLSHEQAYKYFPDTHHGFGLKVPFTGRVAEKFGYTGGQKVIPILPREITNPIARALAGPKNALRLSEFGGKIGTKLAGVAPESYDLLRSGEASKAWQGIEFRTALRKGNAYNAAGMRLLEDNALGAVEGGTSEGVGRLGKRASEVFHRDIVKNLKLTPDELKTARTAIESISDPAELVKVKGATELKSFLHEMYRTAEHEGVPIQELDNYFPRILTDEWKAERGYTQGSGVMTGRPASTRARTILPAEGETNATIRDNMNRLAKDTGVDVGFYEDDVVKTMDEYIKGMTNAIARRRVLGHLQDAGILLNDETAPFAFKLKQQGNFAKVRQGVDKTLAGLKKNVDEANARAVEAQGVADVAQADLQRVIPEAATSRDQAFNSVLEDLGLQGRTPIRPAAVSSGNAVVDKAVESLQLDQRIVDSLTPTQMNNAVAEWQALQANGETRTFGQWLTTRYQQFELGRVPAPRPSGLSMSAEGELRSRGGIFGRRGPEPKVRGYAAGHDFSGVPSAVRDMSATARETLQRDALRAPEVSAEAVAARQTEVQQRLGELSTRQIEVQKQITALEAKMKEFPNAGANVKRMAQDRLSQLRSDLRDLQAQSRGWRQQMAAPVSQDFGAQFERVSGSEAGGDANLADAANAAIQASEEAAIKKVITGEGKQLPIDTGGPSITKIDRYLPAPTGDPAIDNVWAVRANTADSTAGAGIRDGRMDTMRRVVHNFQDSFDQNISTNLWKQGENVRQYTSIGYLRTIAADDPVASNILEIVHNSRGVSARADELLEEGMSVYAHASQLGDQKSMEAAIQYVKDGEQRANEWRAIEDAAKKEASVANKAEAKAMQEQRLLELDRQLEANEITEKQYTEQRNRILEKKPKTSKMDLNEQFIYRVNREIAAMKPAAAQKYLANLVERGKFGPNVARVLEEQYIANLGAFDPTALSKLGYSEEAAARLTSPNVADAGKQGAIADMTLGQTKYGTLGAEAYTPEVVSETYGDVNKFREINARERADAQQYYELAKTDPERIAKLDEYGRQLAEQPNVQAAQNLLSEWRSNGELSLSDIAMLHGRYQEVMPEFDQLLGNALDSEFRARAREVTSKINQLEVAIARGEMTTEQAVKEMKIMPPDGGPSILQQFDELKGTLPDRIDLQMGWTRGDHTREISNIQNALMSFDWTPQGSNKAMSVWMGETAAATKKIQHILTQFGEIRGMKTKALYAHFFETVLPQIENLGGKLRPKVAEALGLADGSVETAMTALDDARMSIQELDQQAARAGIVPRVRGDRAVWGSQSASEVAKEQALAHKNRLDIAWKWSTDTKPRLSVDELEQLAHERTMAKYAQMDETATPTHKLLKADGTLTKRGQDRYEATFDDIYNALRNEESRGFNNALRISHNEVAAGKGIKGLVDAVDKRPLGYGQLPVSSANADQEIGMFRSALRGSEPKPRAPRVVSPAVADAVASAPPEIQNFMEAVYTLSENNPELLDKVSRVMSNEKHLTDGVLNAEGKKALGDLLKKERASLLADSASSELDKLDNEVNQVVSEVTPEAAPETTPTPSAEQPAIAEGDVASRIQRIGELASRDKSLPKRAKALLEDPKYFDPETGLTKAGAKKLDGMIKFAESKTGAVAPATESAVEPAAVPDEVVQEATQQVEQRAAKNASSSKRANDAARAAQIDVAGFSDRVKAASSADAKLGERIKGVLDDPKYKGADGVLSNRGIVKIDNMIKNVEKKIAEQAAKGTAEAAPKAAASVSSEIAFGPQWDDAAVAAERRAAMAASPEAQAQVDAILLDPANKTQKGVLRRSARRDLSRLYRSVVGAPEGATKAAEEAAGAVPPPVADLAPAAPVEPVAAAGGAPAPRSVPFEAKVAGSQAAWNDSAEIERRMGMLTQRQQKQLQRILDNPNYQTSKGFSRAGTTAANRAWAGFAKNAPKAGVVDVASGVERIVADQQANVAKEAEQLAAGGAGGGAVPPSKPPTGGPAGTPPDPFEAANNARLNATKQAMGMQPDVPSMSPSDALASHLEDLSSADPVVSSAGSDNLFADAIGTAMDARSSAARIRSILTDRSEFTNVLQEQIDFIKSEGRGSAEVLSSLEKAKAVSAQADQLVEAARQTTNEAGRAALVHVAEARKAEAQFIASQKFYDQAVAAAERNIKLTPTQERIREAIAAGTYQELAANPNLYTPREIADALNRVGKVTTPEGFQKFLKHYDTLVGWLKRWQVATPGFHLRNYLGGTFNNYLADVEIGSVAKFRKAYKAWQAGSLGAEESQNMARLLEYLGGGQYGNAELGTKFGMSMKPWSSEFVPIQASAKAGENVEFYLRGGLGWDRLMKGQTIDTAIDDIVRYHFDYADLSSFERGTVKRFIPFYTWTRYNMPLQMEMIATNPSKYTKYFAVKNEIESMSDPEKIVPSYIANDLFGIRTPFGGTGQRLYITPDLPFTQTVASALPDFKNFNPRRAKSYTGLADNYLSMMTPVVKTPLEFMKGEQFFKGIPLPRDKKNMQSPLMFGNPAGRGLSEFLGGQGRAAYALEQIVPPYARARRLFPSEDKYQQRRGASVASFFGLPLRTNTESDIQSEILRRRFAAAAAKKK